MTLRERFQALTAGLRAWYAGHSPRDQRIILGVVVLAILSLVYLGLVVPLRDYRQAMAEEIGSSQAELERAARVLGAVESLRVERSTLEKKLQQARTRLLPGRTGTLGAAALQERTNALAAEKGVTIQSTQVMKDEVQEPYRKVAVRLTLSGELKPFAEMVSGLEHGQQLAIPFVEITRRGAVAGAKGPRTLSATMEVNGFVLAEEAKADEAKPDDATGEGEAAGAAGEGGTPAEGQPATEGAPGETPPAAADGDAAAGPAPTAVPPGQPAATDAIEPPAGQAAPPSPSTPPAGGPAGGATPPVPSSAPDAATAPGGAAAPGGVRAPAPVAAPGETGPGTAAAPGAATPPAHVPPPGQVAPPAPPAAVPHGPPPHKAEEQR